MATLRDMIDKPEANPGSMKAYGTSEGVSRAWDTRGRGRNALANSGFTQKPDTNSNYVSGEKSKSGDFEHWKSDAPHDGEDHHVYVHKETGAWSHHEVSPEGDESSRKTGQGVDSLISHLKSRY